MANKSLVTCSSNFDHDVTFLPTKNSGPFHESIFIKLVIKHTWIPILFCFMFDFAIKQVERCLNFFGNFLISKVK